MRKIFGLGIIAWVLALSAGYSNQPVELTFTSSFLIDQGNNYRCDRTIDHRSTCTFEENLLNSEEEDETIKPLAHFYLVESCTCCTLEIYLVSQIFCPASENLILFEADNSPPSFMS